MVPFLSFFNGRNMSNEYRDGYGQAKADCVMRINDLLGEVEDAINKPDPRFKGLPNPEIRKELVTKRDTLRWMRMVIKKTVKSAR